MFEVDNFPKELAKKFKIIDYYKKQLKLKK